MDSSGLDRLAGALFAQLDTLMSCKGSSEDFEREVRRSEAVADLSQQIISTGKLNLDATKLAIEIKGAKNVQIPMLIGAQNA